MQINSRCENCKFAVKNKNFKFEYCTHINSKTEGVKEDGREFFTLESTKTMNGEGQCNEFVLNSKIPFTNTYFKWKTVMVGVRIITFATLVVSALVYYLN